MEIELKPPGRKRHIITNIVACILIAIPIVFFILLMIPTLDFVFSGREKAKENQKKVDVFIDLPDSEYERLIDISRRFHSEEYASRYRYRSYTTNTVMISKGIDKQLPSEFADFGIIKVTLWENSIHGWLYFLFDSGGVVVVDWSDPNQPTVTYANAGSDYRIQVYPKEN